MKRRVVPLSLALLAGLFVLAVLFAAGVERVTFTSGRPFDETLPAPQPYDASGDGITQPLRPIDWVIAFGILGSAVLFLILYLRKNAARAGGFRRKGGRWPAVLMAFSILGVTTAIIIYQVNPFADESDPEASPVVHSPLSLSEERQPADYQAVDELLGTGQAETGRGVESAVLVIAGVLATVACAVAAFALVVLRRRRRPGGEEELAAEILAPVRAAVAELRLGRDPRGVVEQCYREMLRTLAERSRVDPSCLTPREFVRALAGNGLSGTAIGQLSDLFEQVHYGHRPEDTLAAEALRCLTTIATAHSAPGTAL
ncbi:MAG: DUF4129 domain-containing protein [Candidatus Bipolaricaulis sp.]|nr:DUF4129 domain-containing protein [Candidatus Bipolaricaulis sp.]MDD5219778.1 DUF4129 domain-containing protein [Candidatus Bipolaricaulis sp.]MDD5646881.1 DUF4129 domain-containing protein [Candidatus Bipolaricaulis sp.]